MTATATQRAIDAVFRIEGARLIAGLARLVRDVGLAEELAQDALVAALEHWPSSGVPEKPGAWLLASAKNRAIDLARRGRRFEERVEELAREIDSRHERRPIAQRIVRAKRTLAEAKIPFELPRAAERLERLASVLEVIYLVFNEGY